MQLQCCGIEGPKDWDRNIYFNCSSAEVGSREACGVPFSCCKPQPNVSKSLSPIPLHLAYFLFCPNVQEIIKNKQCGYDVRKPDYVRTFSLFFRNDITIQSFGGGSRVSFSRVSLGGQSISLSVPHCATLWHILKPVINGGRLWWHFFL